jgi:hypothetical protein
MVGGAARKQFFFEKKNQKTFTFSAGRDRRGAETKEQKFFGSFFQKRTASCRFWLDPELSYWL